MADQAAPEQSTASDDALTWQQLAEWLPEAERWRVSKRAREPGQFVDQLRAVGTVDRLSPYWYRTRENFIARTLVQYRQHPTYRRWLSLIMWAYWPGPTPY